MLIWLVTTGEPIPGDGQGAPRLLRTGMLGLRLEAAGHRVTWFNSTMDHVGGRSRADRTARLPFGSGGELVLLYGPPYSRNVSLARIRHHRGVAAEFDRMSDQLEPPDVILCSMPTLELAECTVRFGQRRGVPVVLDIRDLWPDVFSDVAPRALQPFVRLAQFWMRRQLRAAVRGASAVIGTSDAMVQWALVHAQKVRTAWDRGFPLAYEEDAWPAEQAVADADSLTLSTSGRSPFTACFTGTLGVRADLDTVIEAARILDRRAPGAFRMVIAGDGQRLNSLKQAARGTSCDVVGWLDRGELGLLLRRSQCGLLPYPDTIDFRSNFPNKVGEYLASGLPILTSCSGAVEGLLNKYGCGRMYEGGSPDSLADAICEIAADASAFAKMRVASRRAFEEVFDASVVYTEMIGHLERIAAAFRVDRSAPVDRIS